MTVPKSYFRPDVSVQPAALGFLPGEAKVPNACTHAGWSEDRVEVLRDLWKQGFSASQIAKKLGGVTRNAVIGKANRMGLEGRGRPSSPEAISLGRKVRTLPKAKRGGFSLPSYTTLSTPNPVERLKNAAIANAAAKLAPAADVIAREHAFQPIPGSKPMPYLERPAKGCRWPVGGEGAEMLACCEDRQGESIYCAAHRKLGTQPTSSAKELARSVRRYVA
jgi:GcrA cell cycle regulator